MAGLTAQRKNNHIWIILNPAQGTDPHLAIILPIVNKITDCSIPDEYGKSEVKPALSEASVTLARIPTIRDFSHTNVYA